MNCVVKAPWNFKVVGHPIDLSAVLRMLHFSLSTSIRLANVIPLMDLDLIRYPLYLVMIWTSRLVEKSISNLTKRGLSVVNIMDNPVIPKVFVKINRF